MFEDYAPRRRADGLKARRAAQGFADRWWSKRWLDTLKGMGWGSRLERGRSYARSGQVLEYTVKAGLIRAKVQGSRERPYRVEIEAPPLSKADWEKALTAMAGQALFASALLGGDMPQDIESVFPKGAPLLPEELQLSCSCPDWAVPCKHVAAVFYILAEAFDQDPFLLFQWRGKTRREVLDRLTPAAAAPEAEEETPELDWSRFWEEPPELPALPAPSGVELSLLRRLGPPGLWTDTAQLVQAWLPIYRQLSREPSDD